ncbi:MAG TPA: hypothetical protein VFZ61_19610 [Polyangiales bacterium]
MSDTAEWLENSQHLSQRVGTEPPSLELLKRLGIPVEPHAAGQPTGRVYSLEPSAGDPRFVAVLPEGERATIWVDRRTMRLTRELHDSPMHEADVVRVADLADRAQLALGQPLCMRFAFHRDKAHITALEPLRPQVAFTGVSYRCVAPFISDSSTLSPLSVDALDRALRVEEDRGDEHRVRRIFGRAYRKVDIHHTPWSRRATGRLAVLQRTTRLARDVALALADARRFRSALAESVAEHEQPPLAERDVHGLVESLRQRMGLVVSALVLLERSRMASLSLLVPLSQLCDQVPRGAFSALSAPIYTTERQAIDRKLMHLATLAKGADGRLERPRSAAQREEWDRVRRTLRHVRSLGMDVRGAPIGSDDEQLFAALHEVMARHDRDPFGARERAQRALVTHALRGNIGPFGTAPAFGIANLLTRVAEAKGFVAEGLSAALLRLRAAALEAGHRLSNAGILERPDDTLYMTLEEIEQALEGELGAYAARARLRREDDRRWRNFDPPRLIVARGAL